ncbi:MAG TPA: helix-turn-helix domain-containing protein [Pyrinomonadaceae bacterium]|nr:helix-turn-helix domain-containing protein [Pyrinomonadaceae bacterium]
MSSKPSDQNPEARAQAGGATNGGTLGQQLRRAREQRGVSLREISDQTRISMRHLEAIEADDYKHLPGGIFNRSFIKSYARIIRFDEREALDAYARTAQEHGETPDEVATSPTRSRIYMDGESTRSPLVTALLSAVILGLLILVVYAGLHWYRRTEVGALKSNATANDTGNAANNQTTQNNAPPANASTANVAPATAGLQVQVKAKGEDVWLDARVDEEDLPDAILKQDESREFKAQNRLSLKFSRDKINALEVSINGQVARSPAPPPKGRNMEWVINKDDYKQFLP